VSNTKQIITEIIREEIEKFYIESSSNALAEIPEIAEDEIVEFEMTEDMAGSGGFKKRLRKVAGKLVVVKKRKKKLPLHLRAIKPSQAKRIARKSAIKRKGKQARISKKAAKTTKKGRARGLYKIK
jgi:hypothetical protein